MGKVAFVFSGQGAQYSGMGKSLYEASAAAKAVFETAEQIRPGTMQQCFEGALEEISITKNTQPCLFCVDLAAAEALREAGIEPDMVAGFSLGEVAAVTFAGIFTQAEGFSLVTKRGEAMQAAAEKVDSAMAAVLKLANEKVEELCRMHPGVFPVNYNCPGQLVVAGLKSSLGDFLSDVAANGGRAVPLNVSGGFHSPFMESASIRLAQVLSGMDVKAPQMPVYANYTAEPYGENDAKLLLEKQVSNPVRWQQTVERMIEAGVDTFVEVGAGKTLCGLIKKTNRAVKVYNVEDADTLAATLAALRAE
ncbi:MAG: ACP S-malonyltransferase [Ruminococcus bromii]|nr:ACP S-malonyltransferase [Ruminococcus bromii]